MVYQKNALWPRWKTARKSALICSIPSVQTPFVAGALFGSWPPQQVYSNMERYLRGTCGVHAWHTVNGERNSGQSLQEYSPPTGNVCAVLPGEKNHIMWRALEMACPHRNSTALGVLTSHRFFSMRLFSRGSVLHALELTVRGIGPKRSSRDDGEHALYRHGHSLFP